MAAPDWFFSLRFRLILAFTLALALALAGVGFFVSFATTQETDRFQRRSQEFRAERVHRIIARHYREHQAWDGLQPRLEQAAALYGRRFIIADPAGRVILDSHHTAETAAKKRAWESWEKTQLQGRARPILVNNRPVALLVLAPENGETTADSNLPDNPGRGFFPAAFIPGPEPGGPPPDREPAPSRLAAEVRRSLYWSGLAAAAAGILLISLLSRRILAPVRTLNTAAQRLGQGDFSQRVPAAGPSELRHLSQTFNTMAENLAAAEQLRRNLAADIAHELRTPLSNIQGYLEAVNDGLLQPDAATIAALRQQTAHLVALVEDLRLLAQAEAGALQLDLQSQSLPDLLAAAVSAFRPQAAAKDINLTLGTAPGLPPLPLDATRIGQVAANLLANAILHTPAGGAVTVTVGQDAPNELWAAVQDSGPGIPAADLPHIFDRFYRVDPSRARSTGGVGLGLAIARQLIAAHGGRIHAASQPGQGSTFTFTLPLTAVPPPDKAEPAA